MKSTAGTALLAGLGILFPSSADGTVIFQETFDSGTGAWYKAGTNGTLSNASGALSWSENGGGITEVIGRSIPTTTLAVGEMLRLTYSYTPAAANNIIRTGLYTLNGIISQNGWGYDSTALTGGYSGYNSFFRVNSTGDQAARSDSGTLTTGTANTANGPLQGGTSLSTVSGASNTFTVTAGTTYTVSYELQRTASGDITTIYTLNNGSSNVLQVAGSSTGVTNFTFNAVTLRQTDGLAIYDNITLEVLPIPEPSVPSLAGVALTGLAFSRRRKN
jgi:hypothetical protein